jgi:hypothetical protein
LAQALVLQAIVSTQPLRWLLLVKSMLWRWSVWPNEL